ncbi:MAG: bifunctional diaminohydroxyphosphoribosylaminopyrimidine deaminase/5-amino-6-(5-phosphoribosylamino)uracil reductase RibD [Phycisphaerales bacterium]
MRTIKDLKQSSDQDVRFLNLAARLALRGQGHVEPNPLVGCVLVRDGKVLAMGHHRRFGDLHAEADALATARAQGLDVRGCTAYVTLEPCSHHGKQPPCTDALIASGVREVVFARNDPHPLASGGAALLRAAGIEARLCEHSPLATSVSDPFMKRVTTGLPWVIAKWAQTIDGRVATRTGESKWISGEWARRRVHQLRGRVDAILTGIGTVVADDPLLTARIGRSPRRVAARVVADSDLSLPLDSQLATTAREVPTLLAVERSMATTMYHAKKRAACDQLGITIMPIADQGPGNGLDLSELLRTLRTQHGVSTVMVEAGPGLLGSLFEENLIDEAIVYIAPLMLGDEQAKSVAIGRVAEKLSNARKFKLYRTKNLGGDVELTYRKPPLGPFG